MHCAAQHSIPCFLQQSLLTVLKESFKEYKAISEGLINLADRFFEMEYLDAHKGLEVYKESIVANDRLQQYYQQIEQIEELRRAIQFPKLESPPADFLTQMEAYAKEAPRPYDESSGAVTGSKKVLLLLAISALHRKQDCCWSAAESKLHGCVPRLLLCALHGSFTLASLVGCKNCNWREMHVVQDNNERSCCIMLLQWTMLHHGICICCHLSKAPAMPGARTHTNRHNICRNSIVSASSTRRYSSRTLSCSCSDEVRFLVVSYSSHVVY